MFIARLRHRPGCTDVNTIRKNILVENYKLIALQGWLSARITVIFAGMIMQQGSLIGESNQKNNSAVVHYSWALRGAAPATEQYLSDAILEQLPHGIVIADTCNRVVRANEAARRLLGSDFELEVGKKLLVPPAGEITCGERHLQVSKNLIDNNGLTYNLIILTDITPLKLELARLQHQSMSDDLTGLYNRRGFLSVSSHQIDTARREGRKLLLIFADLDGLKKINDTLGHLEGDQAIKDTAHTLKTSLRTSDVVARVGGDEFVVLTTVAQGEYADNVIARLKAHIDSFNEKNRRPYRLSISIGTAELDPESDVDLIELLNRADCRMYEHKRRRRLAS